MIRYRIITVSLFIVFAVFINYIEAKNNNDFPLLGKVIYIDPGHGGEDPGAVYKDIYESHINLEISEVLSEILGNMGAIVYMTRYGDYDLSDVYAINRKRSDLSRRSNIINRSECDLFVSIHLNADPSSVWYGAQVFYDDEHEENEKIAKIIQDELARYVKTKRKYTKTDDMYLHRMVKRPGVLIEVGFLSNPNERYLLQKKWYQERLSRAIASGIVKYFEQKKS